ncbi:glycoside hydrolase family 43 protein [Saccharophagus degradans]|uniref:glycoside hydrolase family 43 protein n=1 Tax=Saccharophagus degradans TaxID=86304 RepID=UPI00338FB6A6
MSTNNQKNIAINPILPGFNPDPSICRVGDDYYIATSTFEWYPGVQIHHSKDLVNWRLVARPLNRPDLLDMTGCPDSCGVWAPCLTWDNGKFYLIYTDVKRFDGNFKDTHNYLTTCETIDGEWSERVYLNSSGFDPSLFHDDDGKKYILNMVWDHRADRTFFGGILLQEYCTKQKKLIGPIHNVFPGSELGFTEGPHLYKLDGYYYLLTAEGGTGYNHAMTMARSKNILGPYELGPQKHFITAKDSPSSTLQRAGHGDIVQAKNGDWYAVHLCSRPLSLVDEALRRSPMGRETALEKITRNNDGWFESVTGSPAPQAQVAIDGLPEYTWPKDKIRHYFNTDALPQCFQWLRTPYTENLFSLSENKQALRLFGRESIGSLYASSLVARRQEHISFQATTAMEYKPDNFQKMAGLVCYYNSHKFHYLFISHDSEVGVYIGVMSCNGDQSLNVCFPLDKNKIAIASSKVYLRAIVVRNSLEFYYSTDEKIWKRVGEKLDYSVLSDEAGKGEGANFTGTFVGMCCQDLTGQATYADFEYFEYVNNKI